MANQANGKQQNALTGAVLADAENDDNGFNKCFESIGINMLAHILPEQYDIVGHNLIRS
jgi:nitric oxide dioxygenase